jgi:hypothetical protein
VAVLSTIYRVGSDDQTLKLYLFFFIYIQMCSAMNYWAPVLNPRGAGLGLVCWEELGLRAIYFFVYIYFLWVVRIV